jgi:hypothetical protein
MGALASLGCWPGGAARHWGGLLAQRSSSQGPIRPGTRSPGWGKAGLEDLGHGEPGPLMSACWRALGAKMQSGGPGPTRGADAPGVKGPAQHGPTGSRSRGMECRPGLLDAWGAECRPRPMPG